MKSFNKTPLAILLPILITGCGGSGANLLDVTDSTPESGGIESTKPNYKKVEAPKAGDFSEMGFSALAPLKDLDTDGTDALTKLYTVDPEKQKINKDDQYDTVMFNGKSYNVNAKKGSWEGVDQIYEIAVDNEATEFFGYNVDNDYSPVLRLTHYANTRVGLLQAKNDKEKTFSTIFYRGRNKTSDVPVSGTATYDGHWEFAHQLHGQDNNHTEGGIGKLYDDDYKAIFNTATFSANFDKKKLSGSLNAKSDTTTIDYTIDADIKGNSFTGTGEGNFNFDGGKPPVNGSNGINENSKAAVSGSFYGSGAAELAGRLVENENAFVGVFAAKQSGSSNIEIDGDIIQAGIMSFEKERNSDNYMLNEYQDINFSGNIKKLQIDGTIIDLDDKENDQFQTLAFGKNTTGSGADTTARFYIQGNLTPNKEVPETGTAEYAGSWSGYGSEENIGVFSQDNMDARFNADWVSKSLTGKLYNTNQSLEVDPAIKFTATIKGNSFNGKTDELKLAIDTSTGTLSSKAITGEASISGHFYGSGANELGGHIRKKDGSFGGVFAGKQLEK